jgi:hypothetical protein
MPSTNTDMGTKQTRPSGSFSLHQTIFSELDVQRCALAHQLFDQKATCTLRPSNSRSKHLCLLISYANCDMNPFSPLPIFSTSAMVDAKVIFEAVTTP